jgi:hypothetical protein
MARGDLMSWSAMSRGPSQRPGAAPLWSLEEAALSSEADAPRIGWVQVGLDQGIDPVVALPALVQCFDDALRRFGDVELSGLQVTATQVPHSAGSHAPELMSVLNWFHTTVKGTAGGLIAFDDEMVGGGTADLVVGLRHLHTAGAFEFGPVVAIPEEDSIKVSVEVPIHTPLSPAQSGVSVRLPEWSASALGWALGIVIDTARAAAPDTREFAVRVTRR